MSNYSESGFHRGNFTSVPASAPNTNSAFIDVHPQPIPRRDYSSYFLVEPESESLKEANDRLNQAV